MLRSIDRVISAADCECAAVLIRIGRLLDDATIINVAGTWARPCHPVGVMS
jgi:hypothetical protein